MVIYTYCILEIKNWGNRILLFEAIGVPSKFDFPFITANRTVETSEKFKFLSSVFSLVNQTQPKFLLTWVIHFPNILLLVLYNNLFYSKHPIHEFLHTHTTLW